MASVDNQPVNELAHSSRSAAFVNPWADNGRVTTTKLGDFQ